LYTVFSSKESRASKDSDPKWQKEVGGRGREEERRRGKAVKEKKFKEDV
jgi:hypothetical protein